MSGRTRSSGDEGMLFERDITSTTWFGIMMTMTRRQTDLVRDDSNHAPC